MQIIVKWFCRNLPHTRLDVEAHDRIDAIIARIAKIVDSPVEQFSLWSDQERPGWEHFQLENGKTLSDYQISEGGTVSLKQKFKIDIVQAVSGNTLLNLEVEASVGIYRLKCMIDVATHSRYDCHRIQLGVGTIVMDGNKYVIDYGLKAGSRLTVVMVYPQHR